MADWKRIGAAVATGGASEVYRGVASATGKTDTKDMEEERKRAQAFRDRLQQEYEGRGQGQAPTIQETTIAPAAQAGATTIGPAAQVGQTTIGTGARQVIQAPNIQRTGAITPERVTGTTVAPTAARTAATIAGGAATAAGVAGPSVTYMTPAQLARVGQVDAAQIGAIKEAQARDIEAARIAGGDQGDMRARQLALIERLEGAAAGTAPSAAELQFQRQTESAKRQQAGLAVAAARGGNVGIALREQGRNVAQIEGQAAIDAAILRAKEQEEARRALMTALETGRGQDLTLATKQAELEQQARLTGAELGTRVDLANLGTREKVALTSAELEQQARQAGAERGLKENLTEAQLRQEAERQRAEAFNERERLKYTTETSRAEAQAGREQQVRLTEAGYRQETGLTEAEALDKRAALTAQMEQEARLANQRTALAAGTANAEIQSRETLAQAELQAKVAMDNAQRELNVLLDQAKLDQQRGIQNAELQQQIQLKQGELNAAREEFNATQTNLTNRAQAEIQARERMANLETIMKQRGFDLQADAELRDALLRAYGITTGATKAETDVDAADRARSGEFWGGVLKGGSGITSAAVSDRNAKTDLARILEHGTADEDIDEFMDALSAYTFRYKHPEAEGAGPGERMGVMAQDMEKSKLGRTVVREGHAGEKELDVPQALGIALASIARIREEMNRRKGARA